MSFMSRWMGNRGGGGGASSDPAHKAPDTSLGLMHLRKLFADFKHPVSDSTQRDQEDKLYKMLPIFCKVSRKQIEHLQSNLC